MNILSIGLRIEVSTDKKRNLNSQPYGSVHEYLVHGVVNAKRVAPWYYANDTNNEDEVKMDGDQYLKEEVKEKGKDPEGRTVSLLVAPDKTHA